MRRSDTPTRFHGSHLTLSGGKISFNDGATSNHMNKYHLNPDISYFRPTLVVIRRLVTVYGDDLQVRALSSRLSPLPTG